MNQDGKETARQMRGARIDERDDHHRSKAILYDSVIANFVIWGIVVTTSAEGCLRLQYLQTGSFLRLVPFLDIVPAIPGLRSGVYGGRLEESLTQQRGPGMGVKQELRC